MPKGEVPSDHAGSQELKRPPIDLDLGPAANDRLNELASGYREELQRTAQACALNDRCEMVQTKHVEHARDVLYRMGPRNVGLGDNPHIWSLLAAFFFAIALAIPDSGAMYLGDACGSEPDPIWFYLKWAFAILVLLGVVFLFVAFLIALGPHQPLWFLKLKRGLAWFASKK